MKLSKAAFSVLMLAALSGGASAQSQKIICKSDKVIGISPTGGTVNFQPIQIAIRRPDVANNPRNVTADISFNSVDWQSLGGIGMDGDFSTAMFEKFEIAWTGVDFSINFKTMRFSYTNTLPYLKREDQEPMLAIGRCYRQ